MPWAPNPRTHRNHQQPDPAERERRVAPDRPPRPTQSDQHRVVQGEDAPPGRGEDEQHHPEPRGSCTRGGAADVRQRHGVDQPHHRRQRHDEQHRPPDQSARGMTRPGQPPHQTHVEVELRRACDQEERRHELRGLPDLGRVHEAGRDDPAQQARQRADDRAHRQRDARACAVLVGARGTGEVAPLPAAPPTSQEERPHVAPSHGSPPHPRLFAIFGFAEPRLKTPSIHTSGSGCQ